MDGAAWHARHLARYPLAVYFLCQLFRFAGQRGYNPGNRQNAGPKSCGLTAVRRDRRSFR
jgi:hypothetical protein